MTPAPVLHLLKIHPVFFAAVCDGSKTFEVRVDDRDYQIGDVLRLNEYDPAATYTGADVLRRITYILRWADNGVGACGVRAGYVVLALGSVDPAGPLPPVLAAGEVRGC